MNDSPTHSTRREFLQGKSAADAIGDLGRRATEAVPTDSAEGRSYLLEVGRRAMACQFEVFLNAGAESAAATEAALEALDLIDQLEDQLSVYRHRSEISQLNAVAARRPVRVESRLFQLLTLAVQLYEQTERAFDITSGPLIKAWARLRREGHLPTSEEVAEALECVGSDKLALNSIERSVSFTHAGLGIDLGGIGKGYALDRCAEQLASAGVSDYMIHGGSSSVLARGQRRSGTEQPGWTVGVRHPLRADRRLAEIQLIDRAMGTSGAGTHDVYHQGKRYGHILDPRRGEPVGGVLSTTVVAPSAAVADALSTAFYVLGLEPAERYCAAHPEVAVLLTVPGVHAGSVQVQPINCDELIWRRVD